MKIIATNNAPAAIGPYSQGIVSGGFAYCSGQIPVNPADGTIPEGIEAQAHQSCKNVAAVLAAGGTGIDKVVKTTCFLADMADFATFNSVYAQYFTSNPARSCCAVKDLPKVPAAKSRQLQKYKGGQHGKLHQQTDQFRYFKGTCP